MSKSIDLSKSQKVNEVDSTQVVGDIKSQITKEVEVIGINDEHNQKVLEAYEKNKGDLPNFQIAKKYVQNYINNPQPAKKGKRSIKDTQTPEELDLEKRRSVARLWRAVEELFNNREELSTKLSQASGESYSSPSRAVPAMSEINRALRRIGWEVDRELDIKSRNSKNLTRENFYGWTNWTNNPYKYFFTKDSDYLDFVGNVDEAKKDLETYLRNKRTTGLFASLLGKPPVDAVYKDKNKYDNAIAKAKANITMKVASKLLSWMNQIKANSN